MQLNLLEIRGVLHGAFCHYRHSGFNSYHPGYKGKDRKHFPWQKPLWWPMESCFCFCLLGNPCLDYLVWISPPSQLLAL